MSVDSRIFVPAHQPIALPDAPDILLPSRRRFIHAAAGAMASLALPALAQSRDFWSLPRELWLYRPATKEQVRAVYWANGKLVPEGYYAICELLRDTHKNLAVQFDLVTLDIARGIYGWLVANGISKPLIINSGYRHPTTNASEGGVRNSQHIKAKALDVKVQGVSTAAVTEFGKYLSAGGVGFYPGKDFTHVDSDRVRYWRG